VGKMFPPREKSLRIPTKQIATLRVRFPAERCNPDEEVLFEASSVTVLKASQRSAGSPFLFCGSAFGACYCPGWYVCLVCPTSCETLEVDVRKLPVLYRLGLIVKMA